LPWNSAAGFVHSSFMARIDSRVCVQRWSKSPAHDLGLFAEPAGADAEQGSSPAEQSSVEISLASSSG